MKLDGSVSEHQLLRRVAYFDDKQFKPENYPVARPSDSLLSLVLDQRDCFAALYLSQQRLRQSEQKKEPEEASSVRMNLVEIMAKENQLLRIKDQAWSREVTKLREALKQAKAALEKRNLSSQGEDQPQRPRAPSGVNERMRSKLDLMEKENRMLQERTQSLGRPRSSQGQQKKLPAT